MTQPLMASENKLRVAAINDDRGHPRKRCSLVVQPASHFANCDNVYRQYRWRKVSTPHFHYLIFLSRREMFAFQTRETACLENA